ncbi:MAG TPA: hypothetical protein VF589_07180 [Allosphingosinicella sp.]
MAGMFASAPAFACRSPKPKDQAGYLKVINGLFAAWFARDYPEFRKFFLHPELDEPFASQNIFHEHYDDERPRQRGSLMFNGPSAIVQVIAVQPADSWSCGGHGWAELMLVKFFLGIEAPVVAELRYLDGATLAKGEWTPQSPGAAKR